jgi:hypothetical protein
MIDDNDRDSLIEYRLQQACDTIELAKFLVSNEKFIIAVNRIDAFIDFSKAEVEFMLDEMIFIYQ